MTIFLSTGKTTAIDFPTDHSAEIIFFVSQSNINFFLTAIYKSSHILYRGVYKKDAQSVFNSLLVMQKIVSSLQPV